MQRGFAFWLRAKCQKQSNRVGGGEEEEEEATRRTIGPRSNTRELLLLLLSPVPSISLLVEKLFNLITAATAAAITALSGNLLLLQLQLCVC